jgi:glycine/D-amino acid oxidase-like deaminating enzyme
MPDVAVLGAGIVGATIARELLARRPGLDLLLVDRDTVGSGASRRSAGLHIPRGASAAVREMTAYSQRYWAAERAADPLLPIFPVPMTVLAREGRVATVEQRYAPALELRRIADPAEAGDQHAWRVTGAQYADVYQLTQRFAAELRGRARVAEGQRVVGLGISARGVDVRLGTGETVHAGRVVLAPGPWLSDPAWRERVEPLGLRVKRVVALHVAAPVEPGDGVTVYEDDDAFLLPLAQHGHWLFSYTSRRWHVRPDGRTAGLTRAELAAATAALGRRAPQLVPQITGARVFCDAYSPDRVPVVAPLDPASRVVFAGAANGSGYRLAPAIAARAADSLTRPGVPATPRRRSA